MLANSYCYELLSPSISTKYLFIKFEQLLVSKLHTNSVLLLTSKNKSKCMLGSRAVIFYLPLRPLCQIRTVRLVASSLCDWTVQSGDLASISPRPAIISHHSSKNKEHTELCMWHDIMCIHLFWVECSRLQLFDH